ncbi:MAG: multidrug MFS transporter [Methanomicrobiales archaeon HGW-Methanomicrobiales-2]|nr:MAG: multidrug MFS transporter [Methanomicrobiales archaeon HGW-Methanomicrobiales-2]
MTVRPITISVPAGTLDDLHSRLSRTRWPDEVEGADWDYGTNMRYMKELVDYWLRTYDWRAREAELNRFAHYTADIDGKAIRFIHERGKGPDPMPLVLFHGWPDSICRYLKLIPMLTDPAAYGGDAADSFDVVVPSLIGDPGMSRSDRAQPLAKIAELTWRLMTGELGYRRFGAGGGDGGSPISQILGVRHPESIVGLHLTDIGFPIMMANFPDLSDAEREYLARSQAQGFSEGAYAVLQGTKPQTLAYGLNDSPAGYAAWIIEKFRTWSDGDLEKVFSKDEQLTNIMLYWAGGPSVRAVSYREEWVSGSLAPDQRIDVPVGLALPPKDIDPVPPREYAERNLKDIRRWTVLEHGGHFVAMEVPELMAREIRAFFRPLRNLPASAGEPAIPEPQRRAG